MLSLLFFVVAHVPLTTEGNIVVNGILAACYPCVHHDLSHLSMAPLRCSPRIVQQKFPTYVRTSELLRKWISLHDQL